MADYESNSKTYAVESPYQSSKSESKQLPCTYSAGMCICGRKGTCKTGIRHP